MKVSIYLIKFSLFFFLSTSYISDVFAISMRYDIDPQEYAAYALEFPYVGALTVAYGAGSAADRCSATLVDKQWIITAAHCLYVKGNLITHASVLFTSTGGRYTIIGGIRPKEYRYDLEWSALSLPEALYYKVQHDVALLRLEKPVENITPVLLDRESFTESDGKAGAIIGYGDQGDGINGSNGYARFKLAGTNKLNLYDGDSLIWTDFDHHDATNLSNTDSNQQPNLLEATMKKGDSGGAIIQGGVVVPNIFGTQPVLQGVNSYMTAITSNPLCEEKHKNLKAEKGLKEGIYTYNLYCSQSYNPRIRYHYNWLINVMTRFEADKPKMPLRTRLDSKTLENVSKVTFEDLAMGPGQSDNSIFDVIFTAEFTITEDTFSREFNAENDLLFNDPARPLFYTPDLDAKNMGFLNAIYSLLLDGGDG